MKKPLLLLFSCCALLRGAEMPFVERYADPETRMAALSELVPNTREAFFYTALAHQLAGRDAEYQATISLWKTAAADQNNPIADAGIVTLENRQVLMDYQRDPAASLAALIRRLDLKFDDQRPDAAAEVESLPTRLDPARVSEAAFEKVAAEADERTYVSYTGERLYRELDQVAQFDEDKTDWFLDNLDRADLPGVVPLIDRAMTFRPNLQFSNLAIRSKLTSSQLAALLQLHPKLASDQTFTVAYLAKLRPGAETDFTRDLKAHAAHLDRCVEFAKNLPPALNSLKAHILFHHLRLQESLGNHPKDDFLAFLALPRTGSVLFKKDESQNRPKVSWGVDFSAATGCPPVKEDKDLVVSYLHHFLSQNDSAADFAPFIEAERLAPIHAEARLLAGGDPVRWGKAFDPESFQSLLDETRVEFAPGAPEWSAGDAPAAVTLDLKNTPDLLVRIYEMDLPGQALATGRGPEVTIDLDGLVPHYERHLKFSQAPIIGHRETIDLPELAGPGYWLVEFVGGKVSARTLVRKGKLTPFVERTSTGQTIRVFDETGKPVMNATAHLGVEAIKADATGRITIPDAPDHALASGIIQAGKLATNLELGDRSEDPVLEVKFQLEREQLLADREARLQLRIRLSSNGQELPLDRIKDPALVLKAELLGGVTSERVIAENLKLAPTLEIPFQVPSDLLNLTLTLRGTVTPTTGGDPLKLSSDAVYEVNGDLRNARVATAYFSPTATGHQLEVRGRNGEPLPSRTMTLTCTRIGYGKVVTVEVRTDGAGRVDLGTLEGISSITATGTEIGRAYYSPQPPRRTLPEFLNCPAGREIRIPMVESSVKQAERKRISLLEYVDDQLVRDHFDKIRVDAGELVIGNLPAGDFKLVQGTETTNLKISNGREIEDLLVSPSRIIPSHSPAIPRILTAATAGGELQLKLAGVSPAARVTVVGKRYQFPWNSNQAAIPFAPPVASSVTPGIAANGYLTGRYIGDEMEYILNRRAAHLFPGSMLPRPGLLLHRWTDDDVNQDTRDANGGSGGSKAEGFGKGFGMEPPSPPRQIPSGSTGLTAVCDFLNHPATVRFDLTPAADGSLRLPLADFAGNQFIDILVADGFSTDSARIALSASDPSLRDRRINRPLDPKGHFLATRSSAVLQKGAEATIENLLDADWRAFTTLQEAQQLLYGMSGDDRLREFAFLSDWPDFPEDKKLELLAGHACHEFHLFLARKDRPFFDRHVKPLLAQKLTPTFMDDYLLGRNLTSYLRPYAWKRLNAAEKALLSQALPDAHDRISSELARRWEIEAPPPEIETRLFTQTLRGTDLALEDSLGLARRGADPFADDQVISAGVSAITDKLNRIIIPAINFEDTTVEEAIDFLRNQTVKLDTNSADPSNRGVNILVRRPRHASGGQGEGLPSAVVDPGALRIRELRLRNVPLGVALKYIADMTKLRIKVDDYGVTLVPLTEAGDEVFTRTFRVPPDFVSSLDGGDSEGAGADPFAEPSAGNAARLTSRPPIAEILKRAGINLPEGASATLSANGTLLVTADASELDKVEQLTQMLGGVKSVNPVLPIVESAVGFSDEDSPYPAPPNSVPTSDPFASPAGNAARLTVRPISFADRTKLWREANYFRHADPDTGDSMIPLNRFWLDLAAWDGKGTFLSAHFNACGGSGNEALMCLAVLDLPFKSDRPEVQVDGSRLRVKANDAMLLFYKDIRSTENVAPESPVLVRQTFNPFGEAFQTEKGLQRENLVGDDFRPGIPYIESLVVTNPTGIGRRIDLLAQIPAGAIPLKGHLATLSSTHELEPYGVLKLELVFYFPTAGDYPVYPMQISEEGRILAGTGTRTLHVTTSPAPLDTASWGVIAREGTNAQILARLRTDTLSTLDFSLIRWRLKDLALFKETTEILRQRLHFSPAISAYGFHHGDLASIRDYLENSEVIHQTGEWLDSPLLDVRPRIHHDWQTLEFDPVVNARAHELGGKPRLTVPEAADRYEKFLKQLAWKPSLDANDQLTLTVYLMLQDRVGEGLQRFARIDPAQLAGQLHYDYLHAVVLFHQEKPEDAKSLANRHLPTLPPGLWRDRFAAVVSQADEIAALDHPAPKAPEPEKSLAPKLDLALADDGQLVIQHQALGHADLRLFSVDLEVLFSNDPFLRGKGDSQGEPVIQPNAELSVALTAGEKETRIDLPAAMRHGNVLVSSDTTSRRLLKTLDSRALDVRQQLLDRTLQVFDTTTSKPLPKTYIKVYAELNDGGIKFHKDGYTDLRGKFDYLSSTAVDPSTIKRLAILISHPEKGARTVIYDR